MADPQEIVDRIRATRAAIPRCAATDEELVRQQERQRRLVADLAHCSRVGETLQARFRPGFDREALKEMIAVERECCPFFTFDYDEAARTVLISIDDPEQAPALDAMAEQLGAR